MKNCQNNGKIIFAERSTYFKVFYRTVALIRWWLWFI